ncbi:kinase-like domain-containing protein [Nemania sp. FL0916]|nr:kinase-like domain-containing protein [Nemania sp. FL0916]
MPTSPTNTLAQSYRHFAEYVDVNSEQGRDGKNEEKPYISRRKLEDYFDGEKILSLLNTNERQVDIQRISTTLLQVFSILLGEHHPYPQNQSPFPNNPEGLDAWRQFSKEQWRFLPLQFLDKGGNRIEKTHNRRTNVDVRHVRPINVLEELHQESFSCAKIYKVQPHESSGLPEDPIILKEYPVDEFTGQFDQEHMAYTTINNNMHSTLNRRDAYFLRYHGAFLQGDKFVLLLEYSSEGTLLDLFKRCWYLPRTLEEARVLWEAAFHLLEGLDFLHTVGKSSRVVHQDIKPSNIFVFKDPDSPVPGRLLFKLGDFGMSSTADPSPIGEAEGPDYQGSKMYSAPEISAWTQSDQDLQRMISWQSDIWSFGCVLCELAVWMTMFERGRIEFRQARIEATRHIPRVTDAGYRGAFHDGNEVLPMVKGKADEIQSLGTPVASMSGKFMQLVLDYMLQPKLDMRLQARQLKPRFIDELNDATTLGSETDPRPATLSDAPQLLTFPRRPIRTPTTPSSRHELPSTPAVVSAYNLPAPLYTPPNQAFMSSPVGEHANDFRSSQHWSPNELGGQSHSPLSLRGSYRTSPPFVAHATAQTMIESPENITGISMPTPRYRHSNYPPCDISNVLARDWPRKSKKQRARDTLPGMPEALKDLDNRDQCFIIDNSSSMTDHWVEVRRTALALFSIVQDLDPDGVEVICTNSGTQMNVKRCDKLEEFLNDNGAHQGRMPCRMELRLNEILPGLVIKATKSRTSIDRVFRKQQIKGINVYVLTDGVWEDGDSDSAEERGGGVAQSIKNIIDRVKQSNQARTFLSIQFIRFGENSVGRARLQWLDDKLKYDIPNEWDVVDTTHHTGSIWKMLIGATSAFEDNIIEETEETGPLMPPLMQRATSIRPPR